MRVFKNTQQVQTTSTNKKESPSSRRLSPNEVRARFNELKNDNISSKAKSKYKAKFKSTQTSQYMNGGILNQKRFPPKEVQNQPIVKPQPQPEEVVETVEEEYDSPNTEDYTIESDVQTNDPNSAETKEKLKGILSSGAFGFNPKEKEVLSKILYE